MKYFPLTHAEKRIYITQKTWPESPMWNLVNVVRIKGGAHTVLLRRVLEQTVSAHQSLRLGFTEKEGEIVQYDRGNTAPVILERNFIGQGGEDAFLAWIEEERNRPIDIESMPPHLFVIASVTANLSCLVIKLHHIAADGKTLASLTSEITECYDALLHNRPAKTVPEKNGFLDTLSLEKSYLESKQFVEDRAYWHKQFETLPEPVEPFSRSHGTDLARKIVIIPCDDKLNRKIMEFCRDHHVSPFRLFLAALYAAMARRCGRDDLCIGSATLNRGKGEIDNQVSGMFVSSMAFRIRCGLDKNFAELLNNVRKTVREGLSHEQYPYDMLIAWLREKHGEAPDLLSISLVQYFRASLPEGYSAEPLLPPESTAGLTIYLSHDTMKAETGEPVSMMISYAADTLSERETRRLAGHCLNILRDGMARPDTPLHALNMLSESEINRILYKFNPPPRQYPSGKTVHAMIEEQALIRPHKKAVIFSGRGITYRQLNRKANQLARKLRSFGIGPEQVAGLWADRCLEVIVAQLAILKAGGAFMPVDARYPLDRVKFMLEDSKAPVILTQSHLADKLDSVARIVELDDPAIFQGDDTDLEPLANDRNLAVLIYTSGSTGRPKGVMIEHRSMTNMMFACIEELELTEHDNVSKHLSFSFDASNLEIYPCLASGGTLHIIPEEIRLSLAGLNSYYEKHNITFCVLPTQLGEQFMDFADNHSLRIMITGGEKLRTFTPRNYRLFNGYGPTECTVISSMYHVRSLEDNIPIGKPLPNYHTLILDRFGNLQPVGVPGELCICGIPVARGYLDRPEKNREAFGTNPLKPEERMYHTNDLACWREDGNIIYLGRMDRQVKLRGYRIELGEIEQAIIAAPDIKDCAVIDFRDNGGRIYLCAYIVADKKTDTHELKAHMGKTLPPYMIPARFVQIDELPLTPNGKIDRKRLPEPTLTCETRQKEPPEGKIEKQLAKIWSALLENENPGRNDNFFHIGGDSLKAVKLQLAIEQEFGVTLSISGIFAAATLKAQANAIKKQGKEEKTVLSPAPETPFAPLTVSQQQLYVLSCFKEAGTAYNMPFRLDIQGELDLKRLSDAIQSMVRDIDILRTAFETKNGIPVMVVREKAVPKMEFAEADEKTIDNIISGFIRPFNLSQPPLFRVRLLKLGKRDYTLLADMHHIISDGISVGILLEELGNRYRLGSGKRPELQFRDYALWQDARKDTERLATGNRFWEETFADPPDIELPSDRPRMPGADFRGDRIEFAVDQEITAGLREVARKHDATMHHVLMAAISVLLGYYTESDDLVIGTTAAGRTLAGTEKMAGMFVKTLPVRIRPRTDKTFGQIVREVREMMLQVFEHQDYPIDLLYEKLGRNRGAGRNPLFDVNFVLHNMEHSSPDFGDDICASLHLCTTGTAKFDLSFAAEEYKGDGQGVDDGIIRFYLEYRTALYDRETAHRISGHFTNILAAVAADDNVLTGDMEILRADERKFLIHEINDTATPMPDWHSVATAIERHARSNPDAPALSAGGVQMSYRQLNAAANDFAHRLMAKKFPADTIVAIMADRSASTVIAMLGALKAGIAWVALDPAYPESRIRFILEDTSSPVIAGAAKLLENLPSGLETMVADPVNADKNAPDPNTHPAPDDLAYIIFTSGSTGKPKGIMIEHHSMINFIAWYVRYNGIGSGERCAAFASFSFDVSVAQVFAPLAAGATLYIIPEEMRRNPVELNSYFNRHSITHAHFPTQFAEQFMKVADQSSLKQMVIGGDRLRKYRLSHIRLVNEYGPSETCMASTAISLQKEYEQAPIGTPISNTRVYVLGKNNNLRPTGMPGELCISGEGVARGYLNRPKLTAAKFVPDPFMPGLRMFRTGDIARILPDGNVDFIGRRDFQVKIRGYRIEPGEIERRIADCPGIENVVVMPFENQETGDRTLCAWYEGMGAISGDEIRKRLARELPDYMIPGFFMHVEQLPLNPNGKVDRSRLPRPRLEPAKGGKGKLPAEKKEKQIAEVWEKVIGFSGIGIHDNFFDIGGDSMKAIVLMMELQSILDIGTNDVFNWPTIAEQAKNIPYAEDTIVSRLENLKELTGQPDPMNNADIARERERYMKRVRAYRDIDLSDGRNYTTILLTGATGTLGGYLLGSLLEKGGSRIMLPVRARDKHHAEARIRERLDYSFGQEFYARHASRITAFPCDLSEDMDNLPHDIQERLANRVDCIIHSAANVRHAGEHEEFYRANVLPVKQLLGICASGEKPADFHYISTTSVGAGNVDGKDAVFFSEYDLDVGQSTDNVYVKSKFEAEKLVHEARTRGIMAHIFRVGNITVDSVTGIFQKNIDENGFFQQLRAYLNLGAVPDALDVRNVSFVDCVADAIVTLFDRAALSNETFHIENPHLLKISDLLTEPELGLNIKKMSFDRFVDFIATHYNHKGFNRYIDRLLMHMGWVDFINSGKNTVFVRPADKTLELLKLAGFRWPEPAPDMMIRLLERGYRDRLDFFRSCPLFADIEEELLLHLCKKGEMRFTPDEGVIFHEQEENDSVAILADGTAEVSRLSVNGWVGTLILVDEKTALGISGIDGRSPMPWTVEAVDDLLWYRIKHEDIRKVMEQTPQLAMNMIGELNKGLLTLSRFVVALN
jgi:amino acid adenylation domain-containing protein/thioester reductase-like protein